MKHIKKYQAGYFLLLTVIYLTYQSFICLNPMEIAAMMFLNLFILFLSISFFKQSYRIGKIQQEYDHGDLTQYIDY